MNDTSSKGRQSQERSKAKRHQQVEKSLTATLAILCFSFAFPRFFCLYSSQFKNEVSRKFSKPKEQKHLGTIKVRSSLCSFSIKQSKIGPSFEMTVMSAITANCTCCQKSYQQFCPFNTALAHLLNQEIATYISCRKPLPLCFAEYCRCHPGYIDFFLH